MTQELLRQFARLVLSQNKVDLRSDAVHRNETRAKRSDEANLTQFWPKRQVRIQ